VTALLTLLLALDLGGPPPPRFSAGITGGVIEMKGGSVERTTYGVYGVTGSYRPLRLAAVRFSYLRSTGETHDYGAFHFDTTYHRLIAAPEGRLPLSRRVDLALTVGPALTIAQSSLSAPGAGGSRSGGRWSLLTSGGLLLRAWRLEVRADVGAMWLDRGPDLNTGLSLAYWFR
jgi:hypothetical protein